MPKNYLSALAKHPQKRELWLWGQGLDVAVFLSCSNQFKNGPKYQKIYAFSTKT